MYHVQQPEQHQWSQGWEHHSDEWEVSPYYQELKWDQINRNFFQQQHYWEPPQGYKWIGCEDGKGGYDVKVFFLSFPSFREKTFSLSCESLEW